MYFYFSVTCVLYKKKLGFADFVSVSWGEILSFFFVKHIAQPYG